MSKFNYQIGYLRGKLETFKEIQSDLALRSKFLETRITFVESMLRLEERAIDKREAEQEASGVEPSLELSF